MSMQSVERFLGNLVGPRQETVDRVLASSSRSSSRKIWWTTFAKEALSIPPGLGDTYEVSPQSAQTKRNWRRGFVTGYNVVAAALIPIAPVVSVSMFAAELAWFTTNPARAINTADAAAAQATQRRTTPQH